MSGEATPFPQDPSAGADSLIQDLDQAGEESPAATGAPEPASSDPPAEAVAGGEADGEPLAQRLSAELETLRREHETLRGQYMRIAADFDNFRKRQSRDQDDLRLQIACSTLSEILPVVDNFDRARQQLDPQSEEALSLHRSYQGLYKQLVDAFKQLGVAPMRVEGEPFDPNLHEAVLREPSDLVREDMVIEELQRGYQLNGRVLRHALVKVSMGPGPGASEGVAPLAQDGTVGGEESS
ncbi:nucleotide exchange factor GrpE [Synechococcus sp. CBW1107]|uniref:nucleotide exchange factor GrpE n=1 Tax=Synechococcus sp. CBW1107 TaxID=2789857 RepID=UPI002AD1E9F3|nr:nucleotide exchange factor GrpE [Synechococcus sp. CBW1107]CAK6696485.1 Protein GrpE [Synechococcus sp. CBW1107]